MNTLLTEIYGIGETGKDADGRSRPSRIDNTTDRTDRDATVVDGVDSAKSSDTQDTITSLDSSTKDNVLKKLTKGQREIYDAVYNKNDAFVSLPPSAGKTMPVLGALLHLYQHFLMRDGKINYAPIVLYVVPRKQLAAQISQNDFVTELIKIMLYEYNDKVYFHKSDYMLEGFNPRNYFGVLYNIKDRNIVINSAEQLALKMVDEVAGETGTVSIKDNRDFKVVVSTYGKDKLAKIMETHRNNISHIIVDETQELVPHPGESINKDLQSKFKELSSILRLASPRSAIILMTGSINQVSIGKLVTYFNSKYNRRLKIIPSYNAALAPLPKGSPQKDFKEFEGQLLNRSTITLQPLKELSGYADTAVPARLNLIKNIVVNKKFSSVMIVFSKQRTGQGILKMMEDLIKMLPPYPISYFEKCEDDIHVRKVLNPKSKEKTVLADNKNIEFLKYFNINDVLKNKSEDGVDVPSTNIKDENNILFQCFLRGVAPLIGPMAQIHKKIIQYYFSDAKKLHMILATDAVG